MITRKDREAAKKYLENMMYDLYGTRMSGKKYILYGFFVHKGGNKKFYDLYDFLWDVQLELKRGTIADPQVFLTLYNLLRFIAENPGRSENPSQAALKSWHREASKLSLERTARRYGKRASQVIIPDPLDVVNNFKKVLGWLREAK